MRVSIDGRRRALTAASVAAIGAIGVGVAFADQLQVDEDLLANGVQNEIVVTAAPGATVDTDAQLKLSWNGSRHATGTVGTVVAASDLPSGATVGAPSITVPSDWNGGEDYATASAPITFTAPALEGDYGYVVRWNPVHFTCTSGSTCVGGAAVAHITVRVRVPVVTNRAPVVASAAEDFSGTEGDTIATSGSFTDPDNDALTLTANNPAGTFTDNGDGTWSFALPTDDDVPLTTVTVSASDGKGGNVSDEFTYEVVNADPDLTVTQGGTNCTPSLDISFTDPGAGDTHSGSVTWGDGSADDLFTISPVSFSHAFASAGTYTIGVGVTDDDGGTDSESLAHTVYNVPSGILQPINGTGARSAFKIGSTIPVKIQVRDCTGAVVTGLAPTVKLAFLDGSPDGTDVEVVSTATPTDGTTMRYSTSGEQYIYNLATRGKAAGDYRISIIDASFAAPVTAVVSLRR